MKKVKIVLVGARGFSEAYLEPLLENLDSGSYTFCGVIARDITKSAYCDEIMKRNIFVCKSLEDYFASGRKADLVIISTPPYLHRQQSILAMENGADVLCEKPIAPRYEDAVAMLEVSRRTGKFLAIGFQWSYAPAIRSLKTDILAGKLGQVKLLKSFVSWPRGWDYYESSSWKGRQCDESGTWILDSVASNAAAHYLHNMYFLLGKDMNSCDFPISIRAELFRANVIENFDTCLLSIKTRRDGEILFVASHATEKNENPKFQFEYSKAMVSFNMEAEDNRIIARFHDGTVKDYGDPTEGLYTRLWEAIDAVNTRKDMTCTVETAMAHTATMEYLYRYEAIRNISQDRLLRDETKRQTVVIGLYDILYQAYCEGKLLADMGICLCSSQQPKHDCIKKQYFSVYVDCRRINENSDIPEIYADCGVLMLPESYTDLGAPTRLVIVCHGAGGGVAQNNSQMERTTITKYLLANGYACMDVNGLPDAFSKQYNVDINNNIGSYIAIQSYVKAYAYCMEHFNLKKEVFVWGASMGGISSTNLVLSEKIPVLAHCALCPVLDTYNQIFLHPWSGGAPQDALAILYSLDRNSNGEYLYDESKICGYNPSKNKSIKKYPVPLKCWHCLDDVVVSCDMTKNFVAEIQASGGQAELTLYEKGGHSVDLGGELVLNSNGKVICDDEILAITEPEEETLQWFRRFEAG